MNGHRLRVGLLVNPVAGLGGAVALKGSDGEARQRQALALGAKPKALARCDLFCQALMAEVPDAVSRIEWLTCSGAMGADCLAGQPWTYQVVADVPSQPNAAHTREAVTRLQAARIDLLMFVGGDGTARDVLTVVSPNLPVLGIPAGVKMHSGVFAVSPRAAAKVLALLLQGGLVGRTHGDVRDYDDNSGADEIRVKSYGELCIPVVGGYLQQTKVGGKESEPLALADICAEVLERLPDDQDLVLGPGSTCLAIKEALGMAGTLRGCDIKYANGRVLLDAAAEQLEKLEQPLLVVSFSRGQGFLFGRGNQQLSATFLSRLRWPQDLIIVSTRTKLNTLSQRPLLLDTGDPDLDDRLSGLVEITTGYEDSLLYRLDTE